MISLFKSGLTTLHVRKPKFSTKELEEYILAIPENYRDRLILHSHHELTSIHDLKGIHFGRSHRKKGLKGTWSKFKYSLLKGRKVYTKSCHSIGSMSKENGFYDYVFLSPVFDSISKDNYKSHFSATEIVAGLKNTKQKVYALGGVELSNVETTYRMGFDGVALLGSIWEVEESPVVAFQQIRERIKQLDEKAALESVQ